MIPLVFILYVAVVADFHSFLDKREVHTLIQHVQMSR